MKMSKAMFIILCAILSLQTVTAQTAEERYIKAGELYSSGDFPGAASVYSKLWEEGFRNTDLLYNTGNAYFKSGDFARAVLFFERARLSSPADEDIAYNLEIARSRITDKYDNLPGLFFVRWFDFVSLTGSTNLWALTAIIMFAAAIFLFVVFLTRARSRGLLVSFWLGIGFTVMSLMFIVFALRNNKLINHNDNAVVLCSITTGKSGPGENANELFVLHAGTTVTIEQNLGDYSEVRLPDGNKGWIRSDCMENI